MDKRWRYKNFNMVIELDIAGEFIYNGIQEINRLRMISNDAPTFTALYNISVGIERLQKIVYVLWCMDENVSDEEFEKKLITHSHTKLRDEINDILKKNGNDNEIKFCDRENEFFLVLQQFYTSARYMRFNVNERNDSEITLFYNYLQKYVKVKMDFWVGKGIIVTNEIKEMLGRVIGNISQKYYKLVRLGSDRNHSFTYELRSDSKAEKVFLGKYHKNSLIEGQLNERISFKELMIYLRRTEDIHGFFSFIDTIEALEFDPVMVIEYLQEISRGIIPQMLVDDVEALYEEHEYSIDRVREVDLFADTRVVYEYFDIKECEEILKEIVETNMIADEQMKKMEEHKKYISDNEIIKILEEVKQVYNQYMQKNLTQEELCNKMEMYYEKYKNFEGADEQ